MDRENRGFRLSAVVVGILVDLGASLVMAGAVGAVLGVMAVQGGAGDQAQIAARVESMMAETTWLMVFMVIGLLGTALGGLVAARMARHAPGRHAIAVGCLSVVLGWLLPTEGPQWFVVLSYVLVVPAAWLGSQVVSRGDDGDLALTPSQAT